MPPQFCSGASVRYCPGQAPLRPLKMRLHGPNRFAINEVGGLPAFSVAAPAGLIRRQGDGPPPGNRTFEAISEAVAEWFCGIHGRGTGLAILSGHRRDCPSALNGSYLVQEGGKRADTFSSDMRKTHRAQTDVRMGMCSKGPASCSADKREFREALGAPTTSSVCVKEDHHVK